MTPDLPSPEALRAAFASFELEAGELARQYDRLSAHFHALQYALEASRAEHRRELTEKARLAARLQNLLDVLPGGVVVLDGEGRIQTVNPTAQHLLGPLEPGEPWRDVVGRVFDPRWDDGHDITTTAGLRVSISTQALDADPGQIILVTDVSETRKLQDQLARHKRLSAKGEMAAALAHQVRTPLATALLYVGNLARSDLQPELRARFVETTLARLRHLERLVEDMLVFARGGAFDMEPLDLAPLLTELVEELDAQFRTRGFTVAIRGALPQVALRGNRAALLSVLANLAHNASEACGGSGHLDIAATLTGAGQVDVSVSDDGPGIAPGLEERIFEPFFTTRDAGTGLGLAVARSVVRAHGGELLLVTGQGPGACFRVTLPLALATDIREESA